MRKTVLLLRAQGDFMVALQAAVNSPLRSKFQLVASLHHKALYDALPQELVPPDLSIVFHDFGIKGPMLRAFTNRHFLSWDTVKEWQAVKRFCLQLAGGKNKDLAPPSLEPTIWLENSHRKTLLEWVLGQRFLSIAGPDKVYQSFASFFGAGPDVVPAEKPDKPQQVLILPSARIPRRNIPHPLVANLTKILLQNGHGVKTAYFKSAPQLLAPTTPSLPKNDPVHSPLVFQDFKALVALVQSADFVFSPDSLPIHLCQFLNKPHAVLYPPHGSHQFFTPFALNHQTHFAFDQDPQQMAMALNWRKA